MAAVQGKDYRTQGIVVALLFHALLFLLFYFLVLSVPNPPLSMGGGGSELTYGDPEGELDVSGLVASTPVEPVVEQQEVEEQVEETPDETEEFTAEESEDPEAVAIAVKPEEKKHETKPKPENKVVKEEEPKINDAFLLPGNKNKNGTKKGDPNGNTDTPGQTGKGDGSGGGEGGGIGKGKGPGLGDGLAGWKFVGNPKPEDNSYEFGVLVFRLYVNRRGIIEKIEVIKNQGINPTTINLYRNHLKSSVRLDPPSGVDVPEYTIGTVTYDLSSK